MKIGYPVKAPYALTIENLVKVLSTIKEDGISNAEALTRTKQFGLNRYKSQRQKSLWRMAFDQFNSPIVYLLFLAAFASLYFKNLIEAIAIFIVIIVNALIGFFMELQARSSMKALREMDVSYSKVIRAGKTIEIPSENLTPGDLLLLEAGDVVSGDGRIIHSNGLQVDESSLTGESFPIFKTTETLKEKIESSRAKNMVYKGTAVMNGNAKVIITGIAEQTELGKISEMVGSWTSKKTPLDLKIEKLTKSLIWITLSMTGLFALSGIIEGRPWEQILKTSIALAVAAVPEGLPIVATVALAYGMLLMARKNAIVKKLSSVETLGGVNVILTDKTGTLTENKITVEVLSFPQQEVNVSIKNGILKFKEDLIEKSKKNFELLVRIGTLCNNAPLNPTDKGKKMSGDPVEISLLLFADAAGFASKTTASEFKRISEIPFSSEAKIMGTLHKNKGHFLVSAKGSVEYLLLKCKSIQMDGAISDLGEDDKKEILAKAEEMAASGLRVLAFAYLESDKMPDSDYLQKLVYVGMIGFLDPPRTDIKGAINNCKTAGIKIVMIGTLCNNAPLNPTDKGKKMSGDPVEISLLLFADAAGFASKKTASEFKRISEIPFSSEAKIMGTLHKNKGHFLISAKGSVEYLLLKCKSIQMDGAISDLGEEEKKEILAKAEEMAASGLRVLAFAYLESDKMQDKDYLQKLVYVGMIGFLDPPRTDIKGAINSCKTAGIKIVMITGDHPMTALNIAKKVGITSAEDDQVIAGSELPEMDGLGKEWRERILSTSVFARTTPKQKLEIVDVYQKAGYIVAMTGDGVNDAPALKKADVGIAMGLRGTQVAKETASIVLKDDSFTSISQAVSHGREIFQNIQRFVIYLVSCNLSEIIIITLLGFIASDSILFPLQILFLNIITDVFPALALGLGKGDKTIMQIPPRDPKLDIVSSRNWRVIITYALLMTGAVLMAIFICKYYVSSDPRVINNVAFITLTACQLFHVFNMSSTHSKMVVNEVTKNKFVWLAFLLCAVILATAYVFADSRSALNLVLMPLNAWVIAISASIFPLFCVQLYKFFGKRRGLTLKV